MNDTPSTAEATDQVDLRIATPEDADLVLGLIHEAFGARPAVDPPAEALSDSREDVLARMQTGEVVIAEVGSVPAACLVVSDPVADATGAQVAGMHRVSVLPRFRHLGVANQIIRAGLLLALDLGATHIELLCRREFPETSRLWQAHGFTIDRDAPLGHVMRRELPLRLIAHDAPAMQQIGCDLAGLLRAGDLVIASGGLGAGKTTLTQGLAEGLDVEGQVISPTFVISRIHRARHGGPDLVHVDAYRLGSAAEVDDLDLDDTMASAVTLVEWGAGLAEGLADSVLRIDIQRSGDPDDETREVLIWDEGPRWADVSLRGVLAPHGQTRSADPTREDR